MFKDIFEDIFSPYSSLEDRCVATFRGLLVLVGIGLAAWLAFTLVESHGVKPTRVTTTKVAAKEIVPANTLTVLVGKVLVPQHHRETYKIHFNLEGVPASLLVEKDTFDTISVGSNITVEYGFTRLSHSYQPTRIELSPQ